MWRYLAATREPPLGRARASLLLRRDLAPRPPFGDLARAHRQTGQGPKSGDKIQPTHGWRR